MFFITKIKNSWKNTSKTVQVTNFFKFLLAPFVLYLAILIFLLPTMLIFDSQQNTLIKTGIYFITYTLEFIIIYVFKSKLFVKSTFYNWHQYVKSIPIYVLLSVIYTSIIIIISILLVKPSVFSHIDSLHLSVNYDKIYRLMRVSPESQFIALSLLSATLFDPILEEIFFRGILISYGLKLNINKIILLILTATIFSLSHSGSIELTRFVFGIVSGILFIKTRSIYPGIVLHCINNAGIIFINLVTFSYTT